MLKKTISCLMVFSLSILMFACSNSFSGDSYTGETDNSITTVLPSIDNAKSESFQDALYTASADGLETSETPEDVNNNDMFEDVYNVTSAEVLMTPDESGIDTNTSTINTESIEDTIQIINDRVDWVNEHLWNDPYLRTEFTPLEYFTLKDSELHQDYYDGESLVFRVGGIEYYDKLEGGIGYGLYYDEDGRMIYAEITQYRYFSYSIYFNNDALLRLTIGERENDRETILDEFMTNAINLCLENAYM